MRSRAATAPGMPVAGAVPLGAQSYTPTVAGGTLNNAVFYRLGGLVVIYVSMQCNTATATITATLPKGVTPVSALSGGVVGRFSGGSGQADFAVTCNSTQIQTAAADTTAVGPTYYFFAVVPVVG